MLKKIKNTPIDKSHTYSSENADEYRAFDNGQESYKQKLLSSLDKEIHKIDCACEMCEEYSENIRASM